MQPVRSCLLKLLPFIDHLSAGERGDGGGAGGPRGAREGDGGSRGDGTEPPYWTPCPRYSESGVALATRVFLSPG